jgi:hypothetical protein
LGIGLALLNVFLVHCLSAWRAHKNRDLTYTERFGFVWIEQPTDGRPNIGSWPTHHTGMKPATDRDDLAHCFEMVSPTIPG